ncbi:folylpolyglutamate synthase isoform X2, partial [Tanacetum coccineum]
VTFKKALVVRNMSIYTKVGSSSYLPPTDSQVDLSWQPTLQRVWENITFGEKGNPESNGHIYEEDKDNNEMSATSCKNSIVFPSLPLAIQYLRDVVKQNKSLRMQAHP